MSFRPTCSGVIDEVLDAATSTGSVPGIVAVAAGTRGPLYEGASGTFDLSTGAPMTVDAIFRIASMTKLATAVAAMQLVEQGLLELDTPVARYVPTFGELQVLDGFDGDTPVLRPPTDAATVRQLLTHTSGLSYETWNAAIMRYEELTGMPTISAGLKKTFLHPLVSDPSTRFEYGTSMDWLGLVIEAVSGTGIDAYFDEHVFEPLGMADTCVRLTAQQRERVVPVHARGDDGSFVVTDNDYVQDPEFYAAGHCLYSRAGDYLRLQQALLAGGTFAGVRILGAATVDQMFRNQIGEIEIRTMPTANPGYSCDLDLCTGKKWGLGFMLEVDDRPGMRASGTGGWGGIFNTFFWIDRSKGVTGGIYMQFVPFLDPEAMHVARAFEAALYRALS